MKNFFIPLLAATCIFSAPMALANGGIALARDSYSTHGTEGSLMFNALSKYIQLDRNTAYAKNEAEHARELEAALFSLTELIKRNKDNCINDRHHHADFFTSPLYALIEHGQVELVKLALEKGANPMAPFVGLYTAKGDQNDQTYFSQKVLDSEDPKVQECIQLMKNAQAAWHQEYELIYTMSDYLYLKKLQIAPYGTKDLTLENAKAKILKLIQDSPVAKLNELHFIDDALLNISDGTTVTSPLQLALLLNDSDILHALLKHGAIPTDEKTGMLDDYYRTSLFSLTKNKNSKEPNEYLDIATDYYMAQRDYYTANPPQGLTPVEALCHYAWIHSFEMWLQYRSDTCSYLEFLEAQALYLDLKVKLYKKAPQHSLDCYRAELALNQIKRKEQEQIADKKE